LWTRFAKGKLGDINAHLLVDQRALFAQPGFDGVAELARFFLPYCAEFDGAAATDILLDRIERGDGFARLTSPGRLDLAAIDPPSHCGVAR
jgi:hypothetical protein